MQLPCINNRGQTLTAAISMAQNAPLAEHSCSAVVQPILSKDYSLNRCKYKMESCPRIFRTDILQTFHVFMKDTELETSATVEK